MDNASEIYSFYSVPTTRGTSATCSVGLPTPLDGPTSQNPAFVGPRVMPNNKAALVRVHSSLSHSTISHYEDEILEAFPNPPEFRSPQEYGPEPYEEYFSILGSKGGLGLDDARRRCSTKELINRFESISADNSPVSLPGHGTRSTPGRIHRGNPSLFTPPSKVEKKTSPLRQSFRNLMSVFKKGKRSGKEMLESNGTPGESEPTAEVVPPAPLKRENEPDPFTFDGSGPSSRFCASPTYSLHSGPLLHLNPPIPTTSILPVWVTCDATLHGSHILLTSATTQGIQSTIVVSLRACTDIKSLAPQEIAAEQRALLPVMEDSTDPKVFELLFYGKENQRFAAPTVKDRASWVSAIWDAILHTHERRRLERTKAELKSSLRIDVGALSSQPPPATSPFPEIVDEQVLSSPDTPFSDSRNREVHPLPQDNSSTHSAISAAPSSLMENYSQSEPRKVLPNSVISVGQRGHINACKDSGITYPTNHRALSDTSRHFDVRAHSPSLVNLDCRSVVRKRLVEMQNGLTSGGTTSHDPCLPPRNTVATLPMRGRPFEKPTSPFSSRAHSSLIIPDIRPPSPMSAVTDSSTSSVTPKSAFRLRDELRARDPAVAPTHDASESPSPALTMATAMGNQPSEPQTPVSTLSAGTIDALLDIMDVHAERQLITTEKLDDKLEDVQVGVRDIAANLHVAISGREGDSRNIEELCLAMSNVRSALAYLSTKTANANVPEQEETQPVVKSNDTVDGEAKPSLVASEQASAAMRASYSSIEQADVSDIRRKLDMLLELSASQNTAACLATPKSETASQSPPKRFDPERQVANGASDQCDAVTMNDVKDRTNNREETLLHDEGKSTQLVEQQAESVRYLNELNAWLEAFVNGSTVQFGAVAEDVQKLCKVLGNVDELHDGLEEDANVTPTARTMTLLQSVRKLIVDNQRRDRDSAHLLTTMNGLAAALSEDMRKNAEMRNAYTTESVLGAIERQRRDQERMLRALANELSDDIRGERLRFVEAMKEATAINVQIHVEEFKKELTREVLISTQEVGRLQRERQLLEQQIADLFAFYSKQKQSALGAKGDAFPQSRSLQPRLQTRALDPGPGSPSRGRALPPPPPDQKRRP